MDRNAYIGERVRFYRKAKNISMEKLCDMLTLKITHQQLALYETDQSRWPADLLCEVAIALDVNISAFCGDTPPQSHTAEQMEAEKHKMLLLQMPERRRSVIFNLIRGLRDTEEKAKHA